MKCPVCQFMCSDQRDLCPKCLTDLRDHKRALGLFISNPTATYDDLINNPPDTPTDHVSKLKQADDELQSMLDEVMSVKSAPPPTPDLPSRNEGDLLFDESLINAALGEIDSEEPVSKVVPFTPPKREGAPRSAFKSNLPPAPEKIEPEPEAQPENEPEAAAVEPAQLDDQAIGELFNAADAEFSTIGTPDELELSFAELNQFSPSEECELYFMLAYDVLEKPEAEAVLRQAISSDEMHIVESKDLNKALASVERKVSSSAMSLKPLAGAMGQTSMAIISPLPAQGRAPSLARRLSAGLVDLSCGFILAAIIWLTYGLVIDFGQVAALSRPIQSFALMRLVLFSLALTPLTLQAYITWSLAWKHRTLGGKIARISVLRENGSGITKANAVVRGLCFPVSLLLGGWLPTLWGKRAIHDELAKTVVVRRWR